MIEQSAIILSLESQQDSHSLATIEVVRKTACGLCGKTRGCGNALWGKIFAHKTTSFKAQNAIDAKVGQSVIVGIDEAAVMKSALMLYIVPLVMMILGTILVSRLSTTDIAAIIGAIFGLVVGGIWVKAHIEGRSYYQNQRPKILRLESAEPKEEPVNFQ